VIAAGVGNHSATALFGGERRDLVIGAAQFEGADGLLVFELQVELPLIRRGRPFEEWGADRDALQERAGLENVS
jgi:hypothetical protein